MVPKPLPFEQDIHELETALVRLESEPDAPGAGESIRRNRRELSTLKRDRYSKLSAWETVLVARHEDRPQTLDYLEMTRLATPIICVVIGEGGSGGALGIGIGDRVAMLQHAYYSVISPEGCAGILWKDATETSKPQAAGALRLTAADLRAFGVIDD